VEIKNYSSFVQRSAESIPK